MSWICRVWQAGFDLGDVDAESLVAGESRFRVGLASLLVATLVVLLLLDFLLEPLATGRRRQVGGLQPGVRRAADLPDRDPIDFSFRSLVVLLAHSSAEQVTELRDVEVPMHATPAADEILSNVVDG